MLCSPALGESDTYKAVSGCGGGAENRNAPNGTVALSFAENSEAARYVFVVVVIGDVMLVGRRYRTFVLACLLNVIKRNQGREGASTNNKTRDAGMWRAGGGLQLEKRGFLWWWSELVLLVHTSETRSGQWGKAPMTPPL